MSDEGKYRQLAMFSVIVGEMVITPSLLGGIGYWLSRGHSFQMMATLAGAIAGLGVAFYRISLMQRTFQDDDSESK